jgi:hypothetical protein
MHWAGGGEGGRVNRRKRVYPTLASLNVITFFEKRKHLEFASFAEKHKYNSILFGYFYEHFERMAALVRSFEYH